MNDFLETLKNTYSNLEDFKFSSFEKESLKIYSIFIQGMTDIKYFISYLYPYINNSTYSNLEKTIPSLCSPLTIYTLDNVSYLLSIGNLVLIIDDGTSIYSYHFPLSNLPKRSPTDSNLDPSNLFQARDGFIEDARDNLLLIKRRLKTEKLHIEKFTIGSKTMTDTYMLYLDDFKHEHYVNKIRATLSSYQEETASGINAVAKVFQGNSLVPLTSSSGAPEYVTENILKGKVVILVDGNPVVLILPALFFNFTTAKDELDAPKYFSFTKRILVMICIFFSIFFLGFFVAIMNYHSNLLSLRLIASIKITERGTILPMFAEIILVLFLFELYNLSTSRSPLGYVQNIVVLFGGIFIGQNAVSSGFVGSLILLLTSICFISGYAVSNNPRFVTSLSIFRLIVLIGSYTFGFIGFFISSILVIYYLYNQKSVGVSYLSPFAPGNLKKAMEYYTPEVKE